jgi:mannose-1-phosphate guanylyltransferase/mannose-6-phosphate isomerase-like protein (cupin superfamily)
MANIFAVILAGGSGVRFWPLSRETWPKQMLQIVGEDTLLRQTIKRINGFVPPKNIWIVTTEDKAQDIRFHIDSLGTFTKDIQFIKEPLGRNTAPAIGLTAIYLHHLSPESVMIVMPSDHAISDTENFLSDLRLAIQGAMEDHLVTFGIKPSRPETGYGYIKVDHSSKIHVKRLVKIERFVEKPDLQTARKYLSDSSYFWNSGIFIWKNSKILSEIKTHLPTLYRILKEIESLLFEQDRRDRPDKNFELSALSFDHSTSQIPQSAIRNPQFSKLYATIEPISIDYGVMERSSNTLMVPATFQWSDLGSWAALDEVIKKDDAGNILRGNTIDIGSQGSTIFGGERLIATIGLRDMVVVDTPDATLVTPKEKVQEVRKIVEVLKKNGREEHLLHKTVERPWGSYTVLEKGNGYKIKRVVLKPKARLSLQLHKRRSEHWIVVAGVAKVTREDETYLVHTNESIYIPINTRHRLENPGDIPLQIIEVQNGEYLEEDDIERFDDDYGR